MTSRSSGYTLTAAMVCCMLAAGCPWGRIWAQSTPTNIPSEVRCTLSVSEHQWRPRGPAVVLIELKNSAGSPMDLTVVPILKLLPKKYTQQAAGYWSPVDIVKNGPLETVFEPRGDGVVSFKSKPLNLHLGSGSNTFKVDASKTKWEQQVSAKWPAQPFSRIVRSGDYVVGLDLGGESESSHCKTTEVHISAQTLAGAAR